jgi:hypothetical protein
LRGRSPRAAVTALAAGCGALACAVGALGLPPFTTAAKSLPGSGGSEQAEVFRVTTACHPTFDRFVIQSRHGNARAAVSYVPRVNYDPSGLPVTLAGGARISVRLRLARAHTLRGRQLVPATLAPRCRNLRQVKLVGDFEGYVSFGLGLQRRTGFRIWTTGAPYRIVLDVAH